MDQTQDAGDVAADDATIDLTLSGGGVRASFFSMGVVLYLLDVGLYPKIRSISSVSGGSITNAILALNAQTNDIGARLRQSAYDLSHTGLFIFIRAITFAVTMVIATVWILFINAIWEGMVFGVLLGYVVLAIIIFGPTAN